GLATGARTQWRETSPHCLGRAAWAKSRRGVDRERVMALRFCATVRIPAAPMLVLGIAPAAGAAGAHAQAAAADNSAIYSYQGPDRAERLAAKAREEGTLTLYTSMATTESGPLAQAFEKKYGVKVQLWRALSENVLQRALTEARGG